MSVEIARPGRFMADEKPYVIRSEVKGTLGKVFQAAGVAIAPAVRPG